MNNNGSLSTVKNALQILKSFTEEEPEKKISDLARELNLSKSTASRLMGTLASEGFVIKDPTTQKYRLGLSVLGMSGIVTATMDIHRVAMPILEKLTKQTDETSHLVVLDGTEVVYLLKNESSNPVKVYSHIGKRNPSHCTSSGKVMLAYQSDAVVDEVIRKGLSIYARNTITNPEAFKEQLRTIRENGYTVSIEEFIDGVATTGAPVRDYTGHVIAAVTIVGPIQRINQNNIGQFVKKVVETAAEISENLGYRPSTAASKRAREYKSIRMQS